jgi:hypothetical protein
MGIDLEIEELRAAAIAFVLQYGWLVVIVGAVALAILSALVQPLRRRRHSRALLAQLAASTRSQLIDAGPGATRAPTVQLNGNFNAVFSPGPDPFVSLTVTREKGPLGGPFRAAARKRAPALDQLRFHGILDPAPRQELLWSKGETPNRAIRRGDEAGLWTRQHMDLTGSEYITRGDNAGALAHVIFDMQRRYNPFLCQLLVEREATSHLVVTLQLAHGPNVEEMPALVSLIRAAARAAQLE